MVGVDVTIRLTGRMDMTVALVGLVGPYVGKRPRNVQCAVERGRVRARTRVCYRPAGATASSFMPARSSARRTLPEALASSMNLLTWARAAGRFFGTATAMPTT